LKNNINILIIADNQIDRMIAKRNIGHVFENINLFESRNGIEALEFLRTAHKNFPYLILVDINMPLMNGFIFLEKYEAMYWQKYSKSLIYFVSSSSNPDDLTKAREFHSVTGYLTKPLDMSKIKKLWMSLFDS
jgi:CheY-like chemotaxis protein